MIHVIILISLILALQSLSHGILFAQDVIQPETENIFKEETFAINGYVHADYENYQNKKSTFEIDHSMFRLSSKPVPKGNIVLETMIMSEKSDAKPIQVYGSWKFFPYLKFTMGKFLMPFGLQDEIYYCPLRWSNHLPLILSALIPERWSETGIKLSGKTDFNFEYDIVVVNGLKGPTPDDQQYIDNNNDKMLGGRLIFNFISSLKLVASIAKGKYDEQELYNIAFYGTHFKFDYEDFYLRGGYTIGSVDDSFGTYKRWGYYIESLYDLHYDIDIDPIFRYQTIDPNDRILDNNDINQLTVGFRLMLAEGFQFLTEYQY